MFELFVGEYSPIATEEILLYGPRGHVLAERLSFIVKDSSAPNRAGGLNRLAEHQYGCAPENQCKWASETR